MEMPIMEWGYISNKEFIAINSNVSAAQSMMKQLHIRLTYPDGNIDIREVPNGASIVIKEDGTVLMQRGGYTKIVGKYKPDRNVVIDDGDRRLFPSINPYKLSSIK